MAPKRKNWEAKLEDVKSNPGQYAWGTVVKVHEAGPYGVVEYLDTETVRPAGLGPETRYRVYVDGRHTGVVVPSLEMGLIRAMAWKQFSDGGQEWANGAAKLLGIGWE